MNILDDLDNEFQKISDHVGIDNKDLHYIFGGTFKNSLDLRCPQLKRHAISQFRTMLIVEAASQFGFDAPEPDPESLEVCVNMLFDKYIELTYTQPANQTKADLINLFKKIDTTENWGISPDEAVEMVLAYVEEIWIRNMIPEYVKNVMSSFANVVTKRKGNSSNFPVTMPFFESSLTELLNQSPWAYNCRNYVDMRDKNEITLSDGRKILINQSSSE